MKYIFIVVTIIIVSSCNKTEQKTQNSETTENNSAFEVKCSEPLPEFTLGSNSNPSKQQVNELCGCIYENLGNWERKTAKLISEGKEDDVSMVHMGGFPSRFGAAIKKCGGMNL